jgi:hypothetical protein
VDETRGGSAEAERRLDVFVRGALRSYHVDRDDPARDATSGLSPYLRFGMISARRVALAVRAWADASDARGNHPVTTRRSYRSTIDAIEVRTGERLPQRCRGSGGNRRWAAGDVTRLRPRRE